MAKRIKQFFVDAQSNVFIVYRFDGTARAYRPNLYDHHRLSNVISNDPSYSTYRVGAFTYMRPNYTMIMTLLPER